MFKIIILIALATASCELKKNTFGVATYKTDSGDKLYTCTEISSFDGTVNYLKICTDLKDCNDFCEDRRIANK